MSLIVGAQLLKNGKQPCVKEALNFINMNDGRGRHCPQYATILFSVKSLIRNKEIKVVYKNITKELNDYAPKGYNYTEGSEFRFILEVSLKYKLPSLEFSLSKDLWTWDYLSRYIDPRDEWILDINSESNYFINIKGSLNQLPFKHRKKNNKGDVVSMRVSNGSRGSSISYVVKKSIYDLALQDTAELPLESHNKMLLNSLEYDNVESYDHMIPPNNRISVPIAYDLVLS